MKIITPSQKENWWGDRFGYRITKNFAFEQKPFI